MEKMIYLLGPVDGAVGELGRGQRRTTFHAPAAHVGKLATVHRSPDDRGAADVRVHLGLTGAEPSAEMNRSSKFRDRFEIDYQWKPGKDMVEKKRRFPEALFCSAELEGGELLKP